MNARARSGRRIGLVGLLGLLALGCGGADAARPKLVPVGGKVTLQGRPMVSASLDFYPESSSEGPLLIGTAQSNADGSFKVETYPHGPGLPPGRYKVTVTPYDGTSLLPAEYRDRERTPLRVHVQGSGVENLEFKVRTGVR